MKSPFRKLVRIATILLSFALLFNFLGYYFTYIKSQQNENLVDLVLIANQQKTLSQSIAKNVVTLCKLGKNQYRRLKIEDNLKKDVFDFEKYGKFFRGELQIKGIPSPPKNIVLN